MLIKTLLIFLLLCTPCYGALVIDATTQSTPVAGGSGPHEVLHTASANTTGVVVVFTAYDSTDGDGATQATYGGVLMTRVVNYFDALCDGHTDIFYLGEPATGEQTASVTQGGTLTDVEMAVTSLEGTLASIQLDAAADKAIGSEPDDQTITWTVAEHTVAFVGGLSDQPVPGGKISLDTGQTSVYIDDVGTDTLMVANEEYGAAAGGSKTFTYIDTDDDEDWMLGAASFKEYTPPVGGRTRRML